ncbi:MAG TPA: hypothetical protein VK171_00190 [Fimbriimonas sp.]|nr:hypothetical protein [Fimbriimonas sp.]
MFELADLFDWIGLAVDGIRGIFGIAESVKEHLDPDRNPLWD